MTSLPTTHRPRYTDRYTVRWSRSLREGKAPEGTRRDLTGMERHWVLPVVEGLLQASNVEFRTSTRPSRLTIGGSADA